VYEIGQTNSRQSKVNNQEQYKAPGTRYYWKRRKQDQQDCQRRGYNLWVLDQAPQDVEHRAHPLPRFLGYPQFTRN
jgi:hypothetical protein